MVVQLKKKKQFIKHNLIYQLSDTSFLNNNCDNKLPIYYDNKFNSILSLQYMLLNIS